MCRHEQAALIGSAEGIRCRTCGKLFHSFEEIERDRAAADAPAPADKPIHSFEEIERDRAAADAPAPADKPKRPKRRTKADD